MFSSRSLVVVVHARVEGAELVLAGAPLALIDVVDDVIGEAGDHAGAVAGVEGVVVAADEGGGVDPRSCFRRRSWWLQMLAAWSAP